MTKEEIFKKLDSLELNKEEYIVISGASLVVQDIIEETSDIDLATVGGNHVKFSLDVEEETSTLLKYDIIDLDGPVEEALRESIKKEGITLYEKV